MKYPISWLSDYVSISDSPETLAERLTLAGFEIDAITGYGQALSGITTGRVLDVRQHPNADKLVITQVSTGDQTHEIITGAAIKKDEIVPVSLPGAVLANGHKIRKQTLRGVPSFGMLCSASELGVASDMTTDGLWKLPADTPIGIDFCAYAALKGTYLECTILPNRGDALSIIGLAREIAAILKQPLTLPDTRQLVPQSLNLDAVINTSQCLQYYSAHIQALPVASPLFIQRRLQLCGIRPINAIVDITNYVMLEYGQPLHAFDFPENDTPRVTQATAGETLALLDGTTPVLASKDCIIRYKNEPVALAGIMGGSAYAVTEKTHCITLESAQFTGLRETSRRLNCRTESAIRFEKYSDPSLPTQGLSRAIYLLEKYAHGQCTYSAGVSREIYTPTILYFDSDYINQMLGLSLMPEQMLAYLARLGFDYNSESNTIQVPSWRQYDCKTVPDLAEEIMRLHGIQAIPDVPLYPRKKSEPPPRVVADASMLIAKAVHQGFSEVVSSPFISQADCDKLGMSGVAIQNPMSQSESVLQPHGLPALLKIALYNYNRGQKRLKFIAQTTLFHETSTGIQETPVCHGLLADCDFWALKKAVMALDSRFIWQQDTQNFYHPHQAAVLSGPASGEAGVIHPALLPHTTGTRWAYFAITLPLIAPEYTPKVIPKYPAVTRDLSLCMPKHQTYDDLIRVIRTASHASDILKDIALFDYFESESLGPDYKVLGLTLTYQSDITSLSDAAVNQTHEGIIAQVLSELREVTRR